MNEGVRSIAMVLVATVVVVSGWLFVIGPALGEAMESSASRSYCFEGPDPLLGFVGMLLMGMALVLATVTVAVRRGEAPETTPERVAEPQILVDEYKGLVMYLVSVLKFVERDNGPDWLEYRDGVIAEAEEALSRLKEVELTSKCKQ